MGFPAGLVTLIVNPAAGRGTEFLRYAQSQECSALLAEYGCRVQVWVTGSEAGSATDLARCAVVNSTLVLACGGDGTVHEVIQGVAGTGVAFGVVPVGTHNALAGCLGLREGVEGLQQLLAFEPVGIPLGVMDAKDGQQWFGLMCGVGASGALAHALAGVRGAGWKKRYGRLGYLVAAGWLFCSRSWPEFVVEYKLAGSQDWVETSAVEVLVSRVPNLGGVFGGLTPETSFASKLLQVQLVRGPLHLGLLAWMTLTRMGVWNPWVKTVEVERLRCRAVGGEAVAVQADAEPMGFLPIALRVAQDAVTMMLPVGGVK
jgi:diacylglycerol kinase family enzyme